MTVLAELGKVPKVVILSLFLDFSEKCEKWSFSCFLSCPKPRYKPRCDHFLPLFRPFSDHLLDTTKTTVFPIFRSQKPLGVPWFQAPSDAITRKSAKMAKITVFHEKHGF